MQLRCDEKNGRTVVTIGDEVPLFFRMGDDRDYKVTLNVDGTEYWFTALNTNCPFVDVALTLHENTNKRTVFTLTLTFDHAVSVSL